MNRTISLKRVTHGLSFLRRRVPFSHIFVNVYFVSHVHIRTYENENVSDLKIDVESLGFALV